MLFAELALQGVRGFSPAVRVALKPGYWLVRAPSPDVPLAPLVMELAFPSGADAVLATPGAQAQAMLTLSGNDGAFYCLTRALGQGGSVQRCQPPATEYEVLTEDPQEIAQVSRGQVGFPDARTFEQLFCFTSTQLPSKRPLGANVASGAKAAAAASPWAQMLDSKSGPSGDPSAKLAELERELALSQEVEQLQFQLDGVSSEVFQQEALLQKAQPLEVQLRETRAAYENAPTPEKLGLPGNIVELVHKMPSAQAKLEEGLARLDAERDQVQSAGGVRLEALFENRVFWAGVGGAVLCLLVGAVGSGAALKFVAVFNVVPLGGAAFVAWRHIDEVERSEKQSRVGGRLVDRERRLREQFEQDTAVVRAAMSKLQVDNPTQVAEAFSLREQLEKRLHEEEEALAALKADPEFALAARKMATLRESQDALQAQLADKGAYVRDLREVQRDIQKAKAALAAGGGAAPRPSATGLGAHKPNAPMDPVPALLEQAAPLLGVDVSTLAAQLKDRAGQYLSALSARRWSAIELSPTGAAVVEASGQVPVSQLDIKETDRVYLALRLALLEKILPICKVPVLVDATVEKEELGKPALLARMLKQLGRLGQVLHVTENAAFLADAEGTLQA
jgi:hypothetical protein